MKTTQTPDEYEIIEQALHRLMWMEQKRFSQLLLEHTLTLPQFLVLISIKRRGAGCPIGALAHATFQSHPTMTGIVDRLQEKRLVVRERDNSKDRRQVVVNLTENGRRLLQRATSARRERMIRALSRFTAGDRHELVRLLTTYLETFEKESE
ncbi:MAG: MarR family winged helix-turn-helix transcriptional regulator [Acidobacteriota bacterium]